MKFAPPLITRPASRQPPRGYADPNHEDVQQYLDRNEMRKFKSLLASGKYSRFKVHPCRCGEALPEGRGFCSFKCYKASLPVAP